MRGKSDRNKPFGSSSRPGAEFETLDPASLGEWIEATFHYTVELSGKDGSIVLFAGSMFVTAKVMTAWDKIRPSVKIREISGRK